MDFLRKIDLYIYQQFSCQVGTENIRLIRQKNVRNGAKYLRSGVQVRNICTAPCWVFLAGLMFRDRAFHLPTRMSILIMATINSIGVSISQPIPFSVIPSDLQGHEESINSVKE